MSPTEMRAEEGHDDPVALRLVVVGAEQVEAAIDGDVPRVPHTSRDDFQVASERVATQHTPFTPPIVVRIVIGAAVIRDGERLRRRDVQRAFRMLDVPKFAEGLRRDAAKLFRLVVSFRIPLRHIQPAIGPPYQAVQRVLVISQIGIHDDVFVGHVIAVKIAHDRQLGRVGDVEVAPLPREPLNAVESGSEHLPPIRVSVAVRIQQQHDAVRLLDRLGQMILRSLPNHRSALRIEADRGRFVDERLGSEDRDLKSVRYSRQLLRKRRRRSILGVDGRDV